MQRTLLKFLFPLTLAVASMAAASAFAGQRAVMSGDPAIDAEWQQLAMNNNPVGSAPIDPSASPSTGIFRIFGGSRRAPVQARAVAPRTVSAPRAAAAPQHTVDPAFLPKVVDNPTGQAPGTIVVDTGARYLYLVLADGKAQRYGVGVGREGFGWSGSVHIGRKAEWPTWTPPAEMRKRQPYLPISMEGGPDNPLGARALYLFDGGRDTLFRIHGSNQPWTIGHRVSSGCIRMRNEDVIELYGKVSVGTRVVVM
jgi:lipoprotein-anchoring transpeptidase ErfK/SrfK